MYEVIWQYDRDKPSPKIKPANPAEAKRLLKEGNQDFADFFSPHLGEGQVTRKFIQVAPQDVGLSDQPGMAPTQEPFAAFLSCADARVPVEFIFSQRANDLFVVRVAGNVLGDECLGSLGFAVDQLGSVRLLAVLGHTGCGAVSAAVDTYLFPETYLSVALNFPLQSIISKLMGPVRGASQALTANYGPEAKTHPGFRQALIEASVLLNAALSADVLHHTFREQLGDRLQVVFGVYDLTHRYVGLPAFEADDERWQIGLFEPPADQVDFANYTRQVIQSSFIRNTLFGVSPVAGP
jgi:carbonic anhydrase